MLSKFFTCPTCQRIVAEEGAYCHHCTSLWERKILNRVMIAVVIVGALIGLVASCRADSIKTTYWEGTNRTTRDAWVKEQLLSPVHRQPVKRGSVVTPAMMHWVMVMESGGNAKARGKAGELGLYQLKAVAVAEVNRVTGTKWKHHHALDPEMAELIAFSYMRICETRCKVKTREAVYAKYRGFK